MRSLLSAALIFLATLCCGQADAVRCNDGSVVGPADSPLAANIELRDVSGKVWHLSDLRGSPLILNFWATWCPPCREELPWLAHIQKTYKSRGLRVVGISLDDPDNPEVTKVAADAHIDYLLLFGRLESSLSYLGSQGLPVTLYVDRDGKLQHKVLGGIDRRELELRAQELVK